MNIMPLCWLIAECHTDVVGQASDSKFGGEKLLIKSAQFGDVAEELVIGCTHAQLIGSNFAYRELECGRLQHLLQDRPQFCQWIDNAYRVEAISIAKRI